MTWIKDDARVSARPPGRNQERVHRGREGITTRAEDRADYMDTK